MAYYRKLVAFWQLAPPVVRVILFSRAIGDWDSDSNNVFFSGFLLITPLFMPENFRKDYEYAPSVFER